MESLQRLFDQQLSPGLRPRPQVRGALSLERRNCYARERKGLASIWGTLKVDGSTTHLFWCKHGGGGEEGRTPALERQPLISDSAPIQQTTWCWMRRQAKPFPSFLLRNWKEKKPRGPKVLHTFNPRDYKMVMPLPRSCSWLGRRLRSN